MKNSRLSSITAGQVDAPCRAASAAADVEHRPTARGRLRHAAGAMKMRVQHHRPAAGPGRNPRLRMVRRRSCAISQGIEPPGGESSCRGRARRCIGPGRRQEQVFERGIVGPVAGCAAGPACPRRSARPLRIRPMRVAMRSATSRMWVVNSTVRPSRTSWAEEVLDLAGGGRHRGRSAVHRGSAAPARGSARRPGSASAACLCDRFSQ